MDFSQTQKRPALDYGEHFCKRNQVMKTRGFCVKLGTNLFFENIQNLEHLIFQQK